MNWCILIPILVGLLSALFGYLLGKSSSKEKDNTDEIDSWRSKYNALQADLDACRAKLSAKATVKTDIKADVKPDISNSSSLASSLTSEPATVAAIPFDADLAKGIFGKRIKQDDLKIVEGIGPKIEGLFHNFDIKTWKALSEASIEKCQEVLNSGGERYRIHNPGTWPRQAELAYKGKWEELKKWQDTLDGGKQ